MKHLGRTAIKTLAVTVLCIVGAACGGGANGVEVASPGPAPAAAPPAGPPSASAPTAADTDPPAGPTGVGGTGADLASAIRSLPPASSTPTTRVLGPAPVRVRIGELGVVDAPVLPVGVLDNGEFEVPGALEVGWYRYGARPGPEGSTVLAAHIAYEGVNGVFARLGDLTIGALVELELEDSRTVTYEVVSLETYKKTALPFSEIFRDGGDPQLVLISCGGEFDPVARSYESNIVAYAIPRA